MSRVAIPSAPQKACSPASEEGRKPLPDPQRKE